MGGALARDIADQTQRRAAMGTGHGGGHGLRYLVALAFAFGRMVIHILIGTADRAEGFARALQRPGAASVGEDAEVTDAVHPVGNHPPRMHPERTAT